MLSQTEQFCSPASALRGFSPVVSEPRYIQFTSVLASVHEGRLKILLL